MSIPRVLLVPTHRTGLADAVAAAVAEIATARGQKVRYHHLGPLGPTSCWDRWEGAAFLDPALYGEEAALGLYDVATRGATLSLLSSSCGLLDRQEGVSWLPTDVARLLDCPVVVVLDCRGWGTGIRVLLTGLKSHLADVNLAGAILSGVADQDHFDAPEAGAGRGRRSGGRVSLRRRRSRLGRIPAGSLGTSAGVDTARRGVAPGRRQRAVSIWPGSAGFLSSQSWLTDRGVDGPVVAVAGGKGFTPWSRDSIEVLRSAGAQVRRLDLVEDTELPADTAGLVLAGTLWPAALPDIALNTSLLREIHARIGQGLPTMALGGGMLTLLNRVQDSLGRTSDLAGVIPAEGEILWDLRETCLRRGGRRARQPAACEGGDGDWAGC